MCCFRYHRQYTHGISSVSGNPFSNPVSFRQSQTDASTEALCHQCNEWVIYTSRKQNAAEDPAARIPTNWFKVCSRVACAVLLAGAYCICFHSTLTNATSTWPIDPKLKNRAESAEKSQARQTMLDSSIEEGFANAFPRFRIRSRLFHRHQV